MSKAVLISVQPRWIEQILSGKKAVEIRKTKPKIEMPFKCYIYQTRKPVAVSFSGTGKHISEYDKTLYYNNRSGKVVGEFVCDFYEIIGFVNTGKKLEGEDLVSEYMLKDACWTLQQGFDYAKGSRLYGWHITDLVIYDKPKELREFRTVCKYRSDNDDCKNNKNECYCCEVEVNSQSGTSSVKCAKTLTRPPQSWCYVEEREENA